VSSKILVAVSKECRRVSCVSPETERLYLLRLIAWCCRMSFVGQQDVGQRKDVARPTRLVVVHLAYPSQLTVNMP